MKKFIFAGALLFLFSASKAQTQKWAIGVKVGEPTAISLRKYGDQNALDISFGTYVGLLKSKKTYKTSNDDLADIGMMFNATYLWYVPMLNERMMAYGGVGVQINSRRYFPNKDKRDVYTSNISTGPSVTAGLEVFFAQKPTSVFLEGGTYLELLPKIFYLNPNLAIGIRHNF
ncbi:RNA 3'-terminal phosphate cyclase [Dyadobacter sp. 32]|uniref:RNA 3'-terminal phosphate cyclase n=1 Tax=Dyadobacter sp. 32 TaxID=538966 RepID=UPI0011EF0AE3